MHLRVAFERLQSRFQVGVETGKPQGRLSRDHPGAGRRARPAQEADRRPRPVRRRGDRGQAAAARRGLRVRGQDHRRRGAAAVHPVGRGRRARRHQARAARLPGRRPRRDADRRLLPHGRFLRRGVPGGGEARHGARRCRRPSPVLLEPILAVEIAIPTGGDVEGDRPRHRRGAGRSSATTRARAGTGWDVLNALIPEAEIGDLIVELRSATAGVGTFSTRFDHMAELVGRPAEMVLQAQKARRRISSCALPPETLRRSEAASRVALVPDRLPLRSLRCRLRESADETRSRASRAHAAKRMRPGPHKLPRSGAIDQSCFAAVSAGKAGAPSTNRLSRDKLSPARRIMTARGGRNDRDHRRRSRRGASRRARGPGSHPTRRACRRRSTKRR